MFKFIEKILKHEKKENLSDGFIEDFNLKNYTMDEINILIDELKEKINHELINETPFDKIKYSLNNLFNYYKLSVAYQYKQKNALSHSDISDDTITSTINEIKKRESTLEFATEKEQNIVKRYLAKHIKSTLNKPIDVTNENISTKEDKELPYSPEDKIEIKKSTVTTLESNKNFDNETLDEQNLENAATLNKDAFYAYKDKSYDKSILLFKKSLEIREILLGEKNPITIASYNNLALPYYAQKNYDKALPLLKKSFTLRKDILGNDHPDTATSYNNLAAIFYKIKEYETANEYMKKAISIREKVLPNDHPNIQYSKDGLSIIEKKIPKN